VVELPHREQALNAIQFSGINQETWTIGEMLTQTYKDMCQSAILYPVQDGALIAAKYSEPELTGSLSLAFRLSCV